MDCFTIANHQQYQVKTIEVSFINEALPGDTIVLYQESPPQSPELRYIEGINQQDQRVIFRSQLEIQVQS